MASVGSNPTPSAMYSVYILKSKKDGRYYYGSTSDLDKRIKEHNAGKVRSTKNRRPLILHYSEIYETKTEAIRRERFFKSVDGYIWLKSKGIVVERAVSPHGGPDGKNR